MIHIKYNIFYIICKLNNILNPVELKNDRDVCGRRSDVSLRPFDQRAESIRGNGIDAYLMERAFTHFSA